MIKCVLYDMDNTLYNESSYFHGAFETIATHISAVFGIEKCIVLQAIEQIFKEKGSLYGYLFDDVLERLGISYNDSFITELVNLFHSFEPTLVLYDDVPPTFQYLKMKKIRLGLISNGRAETQRRKVLSLNLEPILDLTIFPEESGKEKPNPYAFNLALDHFMINHDEAIYVGDNPFVDFSGAAKVGIHTVRIRRGEFAFVEVSAEKNAEYEIHNHQDIVHVIHKIEDKFSQ